MYQRAYSIPAELAERIPQVAARYIAYDNAYQQLMVNPNSDNVLVHRQTLTWEQFELEYPATPDQFPPGSDSNIDALRFYKPTHILVFSDEGYNYHIMLGIWPVQYPGKPWEGHLHGVVVDPEMGNDTLPEVLNICTRA